jgi:hypothetical protein
VQRLQHTCEQKDAEICRLRHESEHARKYADDRNVELWGLIAECSELRIGAEANSRMWAESEEHSRAQIEQLMHEQRHWKHQAELLRDQEERRRVDAAEQLVVKERHWKCETERLQDELERCKAEVLRLSACEESYKHDIDAFTHREQVFRTDMDRLEKDVNTYRDQMELMRASCLNLSSDNRAHVDVYKHRIGDLEGEVEACRDEVSRLKRELGGAVREKKAMEEAAAFLMVSGHQVCVFVCVYVCICMYTYVCVCVFLMVSGHQVCVFFCVCVYVYVCICVCVCVFFKLSDTRFVCVYVCIYIYIYIYIYTSPSSC